MGSRRSLVNDIVLGIGLDSTSTSAAGATATINAAEFDRRNTLNPAHDLVALVDVGAWTTDGSVTVHLEHSDTSGSGFTDVADADVAVGSATGTAAAGQTGGTVVIDSAADDDQQIIFGYLGSKRYVRVSLAIAGQTTGGLAGIVVWYVGGNLRGQIARV